MTAVTTTVHHDAFTEVDGDLVQVVREDYADPAEQPGIMLSVKCTTVVLTLAEANVMSLASAGRQVNGATVFPARYDPHRCDRPGCTEPRDGFSPWCADHQPAARA